MEFENAYNHLNDAQRAAVDYIDGPLLVIAGPGTGKTQLLSVRVANILKQTDASPENILCLTFTETGASNMRRRLADFIGPEAYKVQIQTYHAFGSYLLQEHRPDLSAAIDELERFVMIRDIQAHLNPTDILYPEYITRDIISTISDLKAATITPDDIRTIVRRNEIDQGLIYAAIETDINSTNKLRWPKAREVYGRILDSLKTFVDRPDLPEYICKHVEPVAKIYYRSLTEAILTEENAEKPSTKALGDWRKKFFKKDENDRYVFGDNIANKKLLSLANVMEEYSRRLNEQGLFDYDDMILQAIALLKEDDEKRFNAQERFQYILLDEFQDTNDAQAQLVSLLTDNPSNEGKPNIMAVGDDDQAIYGFQGANTSNFFDFDEKYHPHHIFLTKNYRSGKAILDFAHNVIEQSDDRFCKAPNVNIDKRISAENPPANTNIELREFKAAQEEYSFIARKIHQLISAGTPGNKICVIAPKHKYLISLLPYLHSLEIPVSYSRRENILNSPEINEIIDFSNLLIALNTSPLAANPFWFRILSLPYWKLETKQVIEVIQASKANKRTVIEEMLEREDMKEIAEWCTTLAAKVDHYSAEYIINEITVRFYADSDNYELFSNLNTLRDMIATKCSHAGQKFQLRDFIAVLNGYQTAEMEILNRSPYHESDTAVQLHTVHSSKGLEFEHVFMIACDNGNWSDSKGNTDKFTLPRNLEHIRHTGDSAAEKIRVLFVAITRARANLYLTYSLSDFAGKTCDRLKYLDIREVKDADDNEYSASRVLPEEFAKVILSEADDIAPEDIAPNKWFDDYLPSDETRKNLLKPYVEHFRLSPTHLNTFIDLAHAGPEEFLRRYIIGVPGESSFAIKYGIFVHEMMDELNRDKLSNEEAMEHFRAKIAEADADEDEKATMLARAETELPRFLAERGDSLRNTKADSERGFFTENIVLDSAPITGKIDRIEIDEENKTITVADFKTGKPKTKWSTADSTFTYKIQLYFYKFLIEGSREYTNYKVTHGRLDYVAADDEGNIRSLELQFKDAEAAEIRHLINIVYQDIISLELPDTTEAAGKSSPSKAFYDQLLATA